MSDDLDLVGKTFSSPPLLDASKVRMEGLAFIGLSLSRKLSINEEDISSQIVDKSVDYFTHPLTMTTQTQWDFNLIQDRSYKYLKATNDDGWLVGGGENGMSYVSYD